MGESGKVYGVDHIDQLVKDSLANIRRGNPELLEKDRIKIVSKCNVVHLQNHVYCITCMQNMIAFMSMVPGVFFCLCLIL